MSVKAESSLRRELQRVRRLLQNGGLTERDRSTMYGAQQALSWALNQDAANPAQLVSGG